MTALTSAADLHDDSSLRPMPWRRMAWVTWRQHRTALAGVAALLGAVALYLWIAGLELHHAYAAATACHPATSDVCGNLIGDFINTHNHTATIVPVMLQALPALIGAFVGAPMLARELETGTFRFAWTQGFGRWRWTLAKLVLLAVAVAVAAGMFSLLFTWYDEPFIADHQHSSLSAIVFDLRGTAFAAWTLVAFAIGGLAGLLIRRVAPAIVATLAAYGALALAAGMFLRQHYMTPLATSNPSVVPASAWIINQQWRSKGGQPASQSLLSHVLQQGGSQVAGKGGVPAASNSWQYLARHGYTLWTSYQPAGRFWTFQWIEAGWLLGLSVLLIAATVWMVRRPAV